MAESSEHSKLVQAIRNHIALEFSCSNALAFFTDSVQSTKDNRPPHILGYVPDVYVVDVPTTFTVIGEAKTGLDLKTDHSRQQIAAFLEFLAYRSNGVFILAVPSPAGGVARALVNTMLDRMGSKPMRVIVLSESKVY